MSGKVLVPAAVYVSGLHLACQGGHLGGVEGFEVSPDVLEGGEEENVRVDVQHGVHVLQDVLRSQ